MTIFQKLETEPEEVIALYPSSISGDLHNKLETNQKKDDKINEKKETELQTENKNGQIDENDLKEPENKILG